MAGAKAEMTLKAEPGWRYTLLARFRVRLAFFSPRPPQRALISPCLLYTSHPSFMDSWGIGVLLSRDKQMAASRGKVAYYGAGAQVRRILEMGGMNRLIQGYDDRESALKG